MHQRRARHHAQQRAGEMAERPVARRAIGQFIWLGVWTLNTKAIRYYEKCGFCTFGEHIFQIGNDAQKDYLMWKSIK